MLLLSLFSAAKELHSWWKHWRLAQIVSDWHPSAPSALQDAMCSAGLKPQWTPQSPPSMVLLLKFLVMTAVMQTTWAEVVSLDLTGPPPTLPSVPWIKAATSIWCLDQPIAPYHLPPNKLWALRMEREKKTYSEKIFEKFNPLQSNAVESVPSTGAETAYVYAAVDECDPKVPSTGTAASNGACAPFTGACCACKVPSTGTAPSTEVCCDYDVPPTGTAPSTGAWHYFDIPFTGTAPSTGLGKLYL